MLEEAGKAHPDLKEKIDAVRKRPNQTAKETVKLISPETAKFADLLAFVSDYGSIQLAFHNGDPSSRAELTKKVVSNSLYMFNASLLLQRCSTPGSDHASIIKSLAKIIEVSRKASLPHSQWTSYHDATLVFAIAKHGFLDQEAAVKSIVNDSSISWGQPFEKKGVGANSVKASIAKHLLASSGKNVVSILNEHRSLFEDLKGFSRDRVVKIYGLVRSTDNADQWVYRDTPEATDEVSDLPPKKVLVRRAKAVLSRVSDKTLTELHGLISLDPYIAAHGFLEELLRAVLRESNTTIKVARELFDLALKEIGVLDQACASQSSSPEVQDLRTMYQKATEQLELAKRHIAKSRTQAKNVVRVTLGEEPVKSRREGETALPVISSPRKSASAVGKAKPASPPLRISSKTAGGKAIELARKKLFETFGANPKPKSDSCLYLTEVETLVVTIATLYGLPVWVSGWKDMLISKPNSRLFAWFDFYLLLSELAEKGVDECKKRVNRIHKLLRDSLASEVQDVTVQRGIQLQYDSANDEFSSSVSALEQIQDYNGELDNLAKKTTMLLAKIHQLMEVPAKAKTTTTPPMDGAGHDIVAWMRGEVRRWAESFELLGDDGKPLAYTAVEFLNEMPEDERVTIEVASVFDGPNCFLVAAQNASSTRIRSLVLTHHDGDILRHHLDATVISSSTTTWSKKPSDWTTASDVTLLWRLSSFGYGPALLSTDVSYIDNSLSTPSSASGAVVAAAATSTTSPVVPAFSTMKGLHKGHLQVRAEMLVRELHAKCHVLQVRARRHTDGVIELIDDDDSPKKRKTTTGVNDNEPMAFHQKKVCVP
jgi:hypothetical protein